MWIREESADDIDAIRLLLGAAFPRDAGTTDVSGVVDRLRGERALSLSLVADIDGRIAGHAGFSEVGIEHGRRWYLLWPLAVDPADRGHGVGAALVRAGVRMLLERHAHGCLVLGDSPYWARFDFEPADALQLSRPHAGPLQQLRFTTGLASGRVRLPAGFDAVAA